MAVNTDPSQTTTMRKAFVADMSRRFAALSEEIRVLVEDEDSFGLSERNPYQPFAANAAKGRWRYETDAKKLELFRKWLEPLVKKGILSTDAANGKPWTAKYVESAYRKGLVRAYVDARGKGIRKQEDFFNGTKAGFLKQVFSQPERLSKVRLLATRSYDLLDGVTKSMATQMNMILANGMAQGLNPRQVARQLQKNVEGLSKARALTIARTEMIYAHAEGQLDSMEDLGVDKVGAMVEWNTAGDDRVCPLCAPLDGQVYTIKEARGKIPLHPNCRCAWVPASEVVVQKKRRASARSRAKQRTQDVLEARAEGNEPFVKRLLQEGRTDAEIIQELSFKYPGKDAAYVEGRFKIYKKIATREIKKEGAAPAPPPFTPPPPPAPPLIPPPAPPLVLPPSPQGKKESNEALVRRLLESGATEAEIRAALASRYPGKGEDFIAKRFGVYKKIAQRGGKSPVVKPLQAVPSPAPKAAQTGQTGGWQDFSPHGDPRDVERALSKHLNTLVGAYEFASDEKAIEVMNAIGREHQQMLDRFPGYAERIGWKDYVGGQVETFKAVKMLDFVDKRHVRGSRGANGTYWNVNRRVEVAVGGRRPEGLGGFVPGRWNVSDGWLDTWRHETGHAIQYQRSNTDEWREWEKLYTDKGRDWWRMKVSDYSSTNHKEAFAESFSAYTNKDPKAREKLPEEVRVFMDRIMKPKAEEHAAKKEADAALLPPVR